MKRFIVFLLIFLSVSAAFAKKAKKPVDDKVYDLALSQDDILVLPEDDGHRVKDGNGVHLFVKKLGDIQSVLLLFDSGNYNDPDLSLLRAKEFNSVNGNEVRYSYGSKSTFRMERTPNALISSTVEKNFFGECFHIYIPKKMYYGYVIQDQNECEFTNGMRVSVRAFAQKYCDNGGKFADNLLNLNVSDWNTEESFGEIASASGGRVIHVPSAAELTEKLVKEIDELNPAEKLDLVFAVDATDSMKDDFAELRKNWLSKFEKQMKKFSSTRIGLLFYKDYCDEFNQNGLPLKNFGFVKNADAFSKSIKSVSVRGGGDREEAVYEALYTCASVFDWSKDAKKKIILIGDAPPHSDNPGNFEHEFESIAKMFGEKGIQVDCFLIYDAPQKKKSADTATSKPTESMNADDNSDAK
ncbi:vWA domain-containing protein [uncultured Treponema sp.]|uniref:vWA domain-containing protein n=1 Tax=uncultured Treponema sp. TaxID=162155 RepID=UPI0025E074B3|nr:vWA domain-containing protein [uncultured Treponema sp.]